MVLSFAATNIQLGLLLHADPSRKPPRIRIGVRLEPRHAYGIMAGAWFEKTLSWPLESTAVVT